MTTPRFNYALEPLSSQHNRADFTCGVEALDRYLKEQAGQDLRRFLAAVFVLEDLDNQRLAGYYTLAATSIELADLPKQLTKKLPKYPRLPATLLGRLAVDFRYSGQGLGTFLLLDALYKSLNAEIASMAVVVDAIDERAKAFYEYHQFIPLTEQSSRLYLPMTTIAKMFN
ncbi:MAG: GNAT family N-acetyltransferase [Hydrococcus sp. RM1_1_31]|nr:GNAT family N-acetyltransferase [Hydrococcus sp. RM1_1_31]